MNVTKKNKSNQSEAARLYESSSEKNRNLFLFYLAAIAYILITVASTTDLDLLLSEKLLILPILSVGIPLIYFYLLSSLLVLTLHFNLLHNITEHLKKIKQWEKEEEKKNREPISSHLMHPYIFDFAYLSLPGRRDNASGRWDNILLYSTSFLLYFLAPACLFCIQFRFSNYQNLLYSSWHFFFLLADLYLLILFFKKQDSSYSKGSKSFIMIMLIFLIGAANFVIVVMLQFNRSITWLEKPHEFTRRIAIPLKITILSNFTIPIGKLIDEFIAPKITIPPGTRIQKQNLEDIKITTIQNSTNETNAWEAYGENYDLSYRRLVFSDFSDSYMQKIVFNGAHLQSSRMLWTHLQGADMWYAQMRDADMNNAELQGADMSRAELQGANMSNAELQGANMSNAELQGADMSSAKLQGANMINAQLQGANMINAQLQGADMRNAQLQGANMRNAQLQGADMNKAQLQGANMNNAQLQGADMNNAQLQGADMSNAQLQGADIEKANLRGSFCREEGYDSFFDRISARIGAGELEGCNTIKKQFGVLTEVTVDSIIESLRSNGNVSEEITDKIEENINNRVGKVSSMTRVEKGELSFEKACEIIKNWQEGVKNLPKFKDTYADWLNTEAGKESRLTECSITIQGQNTPQSSEKIDGVKKK